MVDYQARFLCWWGLLLFCCKLASRRQLDFQLRDLETYVLQNVNQLAGTEQTSLPVHKTLSHYLGHVGSASLGQLRTQCVRQLIRNKVLDPARLLGHFVMAVDGTGMLCFAQAHCAHCLVHKNGSSLYYLHPVLEAKLLDARGLALSVGTEFIENPMDRTAEALPDRATLTEYEAVKQDCELKAFHRLAAQLKQDFPQLPICLGGDSLFACGAVITLCEANSWSYVLTFKEGRTPALWADFQGLLKLAPENHLVRTLPEGTRQEYRWINDLDYEDSQGRSHRLNALICHETAHAHTHTFAWVTDFRLDPNNVILVAERGGRIRSKIENEGFNIQKNSGLNLEHAYSNDPDTLKAFYYLLQIAHLFLQMFEIGSLLRDLARRYNSTPVALFGSLKNMAQRLLECLRYFVLGSDAFADTSIQIRLSDSS